MSAPVGRWRCMRLSIVLLVGDLIAISRLWVRISKCSRLSLSAKGPRRTQKRRVRVGRGTGPAHFAAVRRSVSTILVSLVWSVRGWKAMNLLLYLGCADGN